MNAPAAVPASVVDTDDLMSALGLLVRRLRAESADHELSFGERLVVGRLAKAGPATIADLARAEGVRPQSMGATVAALEAGGLVRRTPHPTDGRQQLVALTADGEAARARIRAAKRAWLEQAIARLDDAERATLFAAGSLIARMVQA